MTSEGLHKAGDEPAEAAPGTGGTPPPEGAESFNPYRSGGHVPPQQPAAGAAPAPGMPQRGIASAGVPRWPSAPAPRPEDGADSGANEWPSQTSWSPNVTPEPPSPPNWGPSPESSAPAQSRWAPAAPDPSAEQPRAFGGGSTPGFGGRASVSGAASVPPPPAPATPPSTFGAEPAPYNPYGQPDANDQGESYAEATQHWKGNAYPGAEQAARQQPGASSWAAPAEPAQSAWGAAQPAPEQPAYERSGLPPEAWAPAAPAADAPVSGSGSTDPNASGRHGLPQRAPGQFEPPSESTYSGFDLTKRGAAGGGRAQVPSAPDASAGFGAGAFTRGAAAGHQGDTGPEEPQPEPWNPPVRVPGASFASTPPPDDPESSRTSMPTSFGGSFNGFGPNNPNSAGTFGEAPSPSAGFGPAAPGEGFGPAAPGEGFGAAPAARGTFGEADGGYRESGPAGYDAPASPPAESGAFGTSGGFGQAQPGGFNQPPAGGSGQAESGGFGQAQPGGFGPAQPGGFDQPQAGGFGQPESSGFGPAQPGGFNQPQSGGFGQPESSGFNQPPAGGFGQPESGGFGQPQAGGFGQPESGGFGQPQAGGFGPAASEESPASEAGRFAVQPDFGGSYGGDQQHDPAQVPQPRTPSDLPAASPYAPPAAGSAGVARAAVVPPSASAAAPSVSAPPAGESPADAPATGRAVAGSASVPMASKITPPPDAPMPPPVSKGQARVYGKAAAPEPDESSPISGAPVSGTPVSGSPTSGSPVSGSPVSGSPVSGGSPAWSGYDAPSVPGAPGAFASPHQEHGPVNGFAHGQQREEPPAEAAPPHFAVGGGLPYPGQVVDGRSIDPRGPMGDRGHDNRGFDDRGFDDQGDGFPGGPGAGAGFGGPQRNDGFGPRNDGFDDGFGAPPLAPSQHDGFGAPPQQQDGFGTPPQQHGGFGAPQDDSPFGPGPGAGGPSFGSNTAVFGSPPGGFPGNNAPGGFGGGQGGFDDPGDADQDAFDKFKAAEPEPAKDPLPPPKKGGNGGVLIAVVIVAALLVLVPLLLVWLMSSSQDDSAASFDVPVGGCVQESSGQPVVAECAEPGAFTVVSRAPSKDQCADQSQPFIEIRTGGEVLCLAPAVPAAGGASAPVTTG
ncbi:MULTISPECIES: hypothetical protein [Catenuloplanes]|uniref:Uncharacterized protein n=1 Tax=Catenuloplanes niger TaxID=587534 RepID=A0AAE4CTR5_9ACTN|nr:hypothetical protein [Catenuloplanes niger]MDR7323667.1 hypothetical protein [Catenuloplanes niger]